MGVFPAAHTESRMAGRRTRRLPVRSRPLPSCLSSIQDFRCPIFQAVRPSWTITTLDAIQCVAKEDWFSPLLKEIRAAGWVVRVWKGGKEVMHLQGYFS